MCLALSISGPLSAWKVLVRWPLCFLEDGPEQDHCFVQLQGALFTLQSMRGRGHSFCVFVFGGVGGTRYQKVELRICVFICDNVS